MSVITAAADGSALGNPGPAGWAWVVDEQTWGAGGWPHGTNNMGELMAVLALLRATADRPEEELHVLCDSTYAINCISKWMAGWKRRGWKKADGKPVQNQELLRELDEAMQGRRVRFEWVKGHAGHALNELADERARAVATAYQAGREPDVGPGFGASSRPVASVGAVTPPPVPEPSLFDEPAPGVAEELVTLERELLTRDTAVLERLLAEDWLEIGRSGRVWTKAEAVAELGGSAPSAVGVEVVEHREVTADVHVLVWRTPSALRSSTWRRRGGSWTQVFHQATGTD